MVTNAYRLLILESSRYWEHALHNDTMVEVFCSIFISTIYQRWIGLGECISTIYQRWIGLGERKLTKIRAVDIRIKNLL